MQMPGKWRHFVFALSVLIIVGMLGIIPWFLIQTQTERTVQHAAEAAPRPKRSHTNLVIRQNRNALQSTSLIRQHTENPNLFAILARKGGFYVRGKISRISVYNRAVDKIIGYYVPLMTDSEINQYDNILRGYNTPDVGLFVNGISEQDAAQLIVGQTISVNCSGLRVVSADLVFDDCARSKASQP